MLQHALIAFLTALTLATPLPQDNIYSSNSVTSSGISNSQIVSNSVSTYGGSSSSDSYSSTTTANNGNTDVSTYISVRSTDGPFLVINSISPLTEIPLVSAVTLIQQLAASLPKNSSGFASPLRGQSGNISLVLEVGPISAAVGSDFLSDALAQLSEFFGNRAHYAFQAKLRIVNSRGQPAGQESVVGNITFAN